MNVTNLESMKAKVDRVLLAMLGSEELVQRWWYSQNFHFNLEKPYIVWETDPMAVYKYVLDHVQK